MEIKIDQSFYDVLFITNGYLELFGLGRNLHESGILFFVMETCLEIH